MRASIKSIFLAALVVLGIATSSTVFAGDKTIALQACLLRETSPEDQKTLTTWVFSVMSSHPDIKSMSSITPEQKDKADQAMGALTTRLLTVSCRSEVKLAYKEDGQAAVNTGFKTLGESAMGTFMANPAVSGSSSGFAKYVDMKALTEVLQ